jgi:hypothetical protein
LTFASQIKSSITIGAYCQVPTYEDPFRYTAFLRSVTQQISAPEYLWRATDNLSCCAYVLSLFAQLV